MKETRGRAELLSLSDGRVGVGGARGLVGEGDRPVLVGVRVDERELDGIALVVEQPAPGPPPRPGARRAEADRADGRASASVRASRCGLTMMSLPRPQLEARDGLRQRRPALGGVVPLRRLSSVVVATYLRVLFIQSAFGTYSLPHSGPRGGERLVGSAGRAAGRPTSRSPASMAANISSSAITHFSGASMTLSRA